MVIKCIKGKIEEIKKSVKEGIIERTDEYKAPNDTAYKPWGCHSRLKLLCKLCRTFPPPAMDGWRCCSQKRVMSRPIQVFGELCPVCFLVIC